MKRALLTTGVLLIAIGSALASETTTPAAQDVIDARRSGFKKMGAAMKVISEQLKTDAPDVAKMTPAAQAIAAGAHEQPGWFPAGSGPDSGIDTDALPHIWKDTAKFAALSTELGAESANLTAAMASGDAASIRTRFKALAEVCSNCHKSFRAD